MTELQMATDTTPNLIIFYMQVIRLDVIWKTLCLKMLLVLKANNNAFFCVLKTQTL